VLQAGERRRFVARRVLENEEAVGGQSAARDELIDRLLRRAGDVGVGGVGEKEIEGRFGRELGVGALDFAIEDACSVFEAEGGDVCAKGDEGAACALDEGRSGSSARKGFEAERARPRVQIENARVRDEPLRVEHSEERFSHTVRRRTRICAARRLKCSRAMFSPRDAHGTEGSVSALPSAPDTRYSRRMPRFAVAVLAAVILSSFGARARADAPPSKPTGVYVLEILTDDSDEQADALTQALRVRARSTPGWTLLETQQSLEKLTVILHCPPKPDAPCLQRIGDTLKADRYVWGTMAKKGTHQVGVELHLWARGKPDMKAEQLLSDNLKDPSDDALKKVAADLFAIVTGSVTTGSVTVHAGSGGGMVLIDGAERARLDGGATKLDVAVGSHALEVRADGSQPWTQQITVVAGGDQDITATLVPLGSGALPPPEAPSKPLPVRKIIGYSLLGLGAVAVGIGIYGGVAFLGDKSDLNNDRANIPTNVSDACAAKENLVEINACKSYNSAHDDRTVELVGLGVGAALVAGGLVVLLTDHSSESGTSKDVGKLHLAPLLSPKIGGLSATLNF
jgi:hypothetical protein